LIAEKITFKKAEGERIKIQEFEMIDKATSEIYCTWIENGEWVKAKDECESQTFTSTIMNQDTNQESEGITEESPIEAEPPVEDEEPPAEEELTGQPPTEEPPPTEQPSAEFFNEAQSE